MKIIDTHCHLDFSVFDADREDVIQRAQKAGVLAMLIPGVKASAWSNIKQLCHSHKGLYPAYGLHPMFVYEHQQGDIDQLAQWIELENPRAIGEIGLDLYHKNSSLQQQQPLFEQQLEIAKQYDLPVLLHVRKAHEQVLKLLKKYQINQGIVHAFSGSIEQANQYTQQGFKLGIGGMVTYERSSKLHKLIKDIPLDCLVLETDAPDMSGAAHHGQRNSPEYLPEVVQRIADLKMISVNEVCSLTTATACNTLNLNCIHSLSEFP